MRCDYKSCLWSILSHVSGHVRHCGALYHSEVDSQLGAYESTVQQSRYSILACLDWSLENLLGDDEPAHPQWSSILLSFPYCGIPFFIVLNVVLAFPRLAYCFCYFHYCVSHSCSFDCSFVLLHIVILSLACIFICFASTVPSRRMYCVLREQAYMYFAFVIMTLCRLVIVFLIPFPHA